MNEQWRDHYKSRRDYHNTMMINNLFSKPDTTGIRETSFLQSSFVLLSFHIILDIEFHPDSIINQFDNFKIVELIN